MIAADFYVGLEPPSIISNEADEPYYLGYDETVHPPLYFRLVALPLAALRHLDIPSQLYVARAVSLALFLVTDPGQFDVVVTNNLFGDIVTDIGAGTVSSLLTKMAKSGELVKAERGYKLP